MFRVNRRDFVSSRSLVLPLLIAAFRVYFTFPSLFRADLMFELCGAAALNAAIFALDLANNVGGIL